MWEGLHTFWGYYILLAALAVAKIPKCTEALKTWDKPGRLIETFCEKIETMSFNRTGFLIETIEYQRRTSLDFLSLTEARSHLDSVVVYNPGWDSIVTVHHRELEEMEARVKLPGSTESLELVIILMNRQY